jgi:hypothetical protein
VRPPELLHLFLHTASLAAQHVLTNCLEPSGGNSAVQVCINTLASLVQELQLQQRWPQLAGIAELMLRALVRKVGGLLLL